MGMFAGSANVLNKRPSSKTKAAHHRLHRTRFFYRSLCINLLLPSAFLPIIKTLESPPIVNSGNRAQSLVLHSLAADLKQKSLYWPPAILRAPLCGCFFPAYLSALPQGCSAPETLFSLQAAPAAATPMRGGAAGRLGSDGKHTAGVSCLDFTARHGGQRALESDCVHLIVQ